MVKNGSVKRRAKRARSTGKRRRNVVRMTTTPPLLNFNKQLMNTVIRGSTVKGITNNSLLVVDFTVASLIASYSQLVSVFTEFKIARVKVWAYTTLSTSASGVATMLVTPHDEVSPATSYEQLTSTPGAIVRRIWQPFHGNYYPTSPSDREWFIADSKKQLCTLHFFAKDIPAPNDAVTKNEIQIVWDVHIKCRGLKTPAKQDELLSSFEVMTTN